MAESFIPFSYKPSETQIIHSLSEQRFKPYLALAKQDRDYAFALYLYNARLAKALLFPLQIVEVLLRNRVDLVLSKQFSNNWPYDKSFISILNSKTQQSLDKSKENHKKKDDIIASLSFDFWSNLFRQEYGQTIWQTNMRLLLPNNPHFSRKDFQKEIKRINDIRNRVAHHEPILSVNISETYSLMLMILTYICKDTHDWVKHFGTINIAIRSKPEANKPAILTLEERIDDNFIIVNDIDDLSNISNEKDFYLLVKGTKIITISREIIQKYIFCQLDNDSNILLDLKSLSFNDICKTLKLSNNTTILDGAEPYANVRNYFSDKKPFIVGMKNKKPIGVLVKSHRIY